MKKLILISILFLSMFLVSFVRYEKNTNTKTEDRELYTSLMREGYVMLPEIVVTYDTVKCTCEVTIKHRPEMNGRRGMEFGQRGRMNPMMGRGFMNPRMGEFQRGRMNPRMGQWRPRFEQREKMGQMDSTRQKQMMGHRHMNHRPPMNQKPEPNNYVIQR